MNKKSDKRQPTLLLKQHVQGEETLTRDSGYRLAIGCTRTKKTSTASTLPNKVGAELHTTHQT